MFEKFVTEYFPSYTTALDPATFTEYTPYLIVLFLFVKCATPNSAGTTKIECEAEGGTWSTAQKIRSAISFHFAWVESCSTQVWTKQPNGKFVGNPSLSPEVTRYMRALGRQKVYLPRIYRE